MNRAFEKNCPEHWRQSRTQLSRKRCCAAAGQNMS